MASQGFGFIANNWVEMLAVAFIVFGLLNALSTVDDSDFNMIFENSNLTFEQKGWNFVVFATTFGAITPSYQYNIPFLDGYIVGINDIPYFDLTDLIILVPVVYFFLWILKKMTFHKHPIYNFLIRALVLILIIIVAFLITKAVQYQLYLSSGVKLGFTKELLIETRNAVLLTTEQFTGIFVVLAILGGAGAIKKINNKFG